MTQATPDIPTDLLKTPPHSIQAEQAVLGGLLINNGAWVDVADRVNAHDFYLREHQVLLNAMQQMLNDNKPCDALTVAEYLLEQGLLDKDITGEYIGHLSVNTPSIANIIAYADIVRERAIVRELIALGQRIVDGGYKNIAAQDLLEGSQKLLHRVFDRRSNNGEGCSHVANAMSATINDIDLAFNNDGAITGISTGFNGLDEMLGGMQRSDLIIVAGRPSMGKTAFAMNIVQHVACDVQLPVVVFSLEMPEKQLAMRLLASMTHISQTRLKQGKINDDEWPDVTCAIAAINQTQLYIDDQGGISPLDIQTRARRLAMQVGKLGLIVVDYLQLIQVPGSKENRATEVSEISRSLKALAKELDVPVIALSQLNRNLEARNDKRPLMADLRESGSIEQDADVIVFVYRDEVYNEDSEDKGTAEIIVSKHRNGAIGMRRLAFQPHLTRFENLTPLERP